MAFYHAADICVHPTYYDPCSRVVLEALSAGVPCITTRYNGAAEVIRNGVHGYVLDSPDDVAGLALTIRRLGDPKRRKACAAAAEQLRPRLSMQRHAAATLRLYKEILARRDKGTR